MDSNSTGAENRKEFEPIRILGIVGSPRKNGNTEIMVEKALEGAREVSQATTEIFLFHGRTFEGCKASCIRYCQKHGKTYSDYNLVIYDFAKSDGIQKRKKHEIHDEELAEAVKILEMDNSTNARAKIKDIYGNDILAEAVEVVEFREKVGG